MFARNNIGPNDTDSTENSELLSQTLHAGVITNAPPIRLSLGDQELGVVAPIRGSLVDIHPNTQYGRRIQLARFIQTLQLADEVLGMEADLAAFDALVKERDFYVQLGAVPLVEAVRTQHEIPLGKVVAVEKSPFETGQPAVIVQGNSDSTAMLTNGAELLTPRVIASYESDKEILLPIV